MAKIHKAKYWFAWRPVRTSDTHKIIWLKRVYREWWYNKYYFEYPDNKQEDTSHES